MSEHLTTSQGAIPRHVIFDMISNELDHAYAKHGREQWGRHEFYGIAAEEFNREIFDAICADAPQGELCDEIVQLAAMCVRYLETGDRYRAPVHDYSPVSARDGHFECAVCGREHRT